jgi:hypothetical protein
MLTDYPFAKRTLERLRRGAAGVYLDDFTTWLADGGYAPATIRSYIYAADSSSSVVTFAYPMPSSRCCSPSDYVE